MNNKDNCNEIGLHGPNYIIINTPQDGIHIFG